MREAGFYWVLDKIEGRWMVAEFRVDRWYLPGDEIEETDSAFARVGPKLEPPE